IRAVPPLPGDFDISREWGNEDESDQQRWMWSEIYAKDGTAIGTLVLIVYHDHTRFRVPRNPDVIALSEVACADVIKELSKLSPDFARALPFTEEYERYLRSLEQN